MRVCHICTRLLVPASRLKKSQGNTSTPSQGKPCPTCTWLHVTHFGNLHVTASLIIGSVICIRLNVAFWLVRSSASHHLSHLIQIQQTRYRRTWLNQSGSSVVHDWGVYQAALASRNSLRTASIKYLVVDSYYQAHVLCPTIAMPIHIRSPSGVHPTLFE